MTYNLTNKINYFLAGICCLLSLFVNAQQIDVLLESTVDSAAYTHCVDIQLKSNSSIRIGTSSVFIEYNENALSFNYYTSNSFDGSALCVASAANAWDPHSFDGVSSPGNFNLTLTLLNKEFSCPAITKTAIELGTICFNVVDEESNPMIKVNLENTQFNSAVSNDGSKLLTLDLTSY